MCTPRSFNSVILAPQPRVVPLGGQVAKQKQRGASGLGVPPTFPQIPTSCFFHDLGPWRSRHLPRDRFFIQRWVLNGPRAQKRPPEAESSPKPPVVLFPRRRRSERVPGPGVPPGLQCQQATPRWPQGRKDDRASRAAARAAKVPLSRVAARGREDSPRRPALQFCWARRPPGCPDRFPQDRFSSCDV